MLFLPPREKPGCQVLRRSLKARPCYGTVLFYKTNLTITSSGSWKKKETIPSQYCAHRRVNQAYLPADDVILVTSPISSGLPAPQTPSQLIALLRTCSFSGGSGTRAPGACATSYLCQDTRRPWWTARPPPRPGAEGVLPCHFCLGPVVLLQRGCKPTAQRLSLWAAWVFV